MSLERAKVTDPLSRACRGLAETAAARAKQRVETAFILLRVWSKWCCL